MRTERFQTPRGWRAAMAGALLHLCLGGFAFAAPLGSFGNHNVTSERGIDLGYPHLPRAMADVDADGRADYCRFVGNTLGIFLSCALALPSGGFGRYEVSSDPGFDAGHAHLPREMADVNGDGRADYCRFVGNAPDIFLSCALATAERRFGSYDLNSRPGYATGQPDRPRGFADVDGDGRADYCRFLLNRLGVRLACGLAGASGFGDFEVNSAIGLPAGDPSLPRGFVDANSDGRADYCRFLGSGPAARLSCALGQAGPGFGFFSVGGPTVAAGFHLGLAAYPRGFGDVTGDGRADYCRFVGSPAVLACAAADGNGGFGHFDVVSAPVSTGPAPYPVGTPGLLRALADVDADGRADYCRFIGDSLGTFLSCGLSRPAPRPSGLPDFAGTLFTPKMARASGVRKVVAILWDPHRPDHPALPAEAIDRLLFGANPSVRDWYRENSGKRFRLAREAVLGWYAADRPADHYWAGDADKGDAWLDGHVEKWAEAIRKADVDFDFAARDADGDKVLEPEELAILIVIPQNGPFGTVRQPAGRQVPAFEPLVVDGVTIPVIAEWYTGSPANLGAPTHELSHLLLGTPDLYMNAPWAFAAEAFSIMDISYSTTHFDPFVKLKTGWLSTRAVTASGTYLLRDVETRREAIILYDPARGPGEYFLIENRWRGASYDAGRGGTGLPGDGIAIWHILENPALLPLSTPPTGGPGEWGRRGIRLVRANGGVPQDDSKALFRAAGTVVGPDTAPARLRWIDGTSSRFTVKLLSAPGPIMAISVSR